ncbi:MAG: nucleoside hydrolase [Gammaproteobacteria bacterium]
MTPALPIGTKPNVVFDTDPGADDALALIWLCALHRSGRINLAHVTAVGGNVGIDDTWMNADLLLQLCQCPDVPLSAGSAAGGEQARHVHGDDGLAGLRAQLPLTPRTRSAAPARDVLTQLNAMEPAPALIAVGPLTNLAQALQQNPDALQQAQRLVVMGGALDGGNITPYAEFNVHHDPRSWATTLAQAPLDIITLETTHQVFFDQDITQLRLPGALGRFVHGLLRAMCQASIARLGKPRFFVHDALAVAAVCYPDLIEFGDITLGVVLQGARCGALDRAAPDARPARVATSIDAEGLKKQLIVDISALCAALA